MLRMQYLQYCLLCAWHSATKSFPTANPSYASSTGLSHARGYLTPYSNPTRDQHRGVLKGFISQPPFHLMAFLLVRKRRRPQHPPYLLWVYGQRLH